MKPRTFVNVGHLIRFEQQILSLKVKVEVESFSLGGEKVEITSPVTFEGLARRLSRGIQVEGEFSGEVFLNCARCLEKFRFSIKRKISEFFALTEYQAQLPEDLDYYLIQGENIELGPMIREQIALAIPFKALCTESCLGLCPHCGENLNQGPCSCQRKQLGVKSQALKER